MNKIDEFMGHFHNLNIKYDERVKGFSPRGIFVEHLLVVGFNNYFINAILNEEGDNVSRNPTHDTGDLEMILNTNEFQDPKLVLKSLFLTKQEFDEQVDIFKGLSFENFYGILDYSEDDMENWLVDYLIKNQDIEEAL
jgi:hypothetical protein